MESECRSKSHTEHTPEDPKTPIPEILSYFCHSWFTQLLSVDHEHTVLYRPLGMLRASNADRARVHAPRRV